MGGSIGHVHAALGRRRGRLPGPQGVSLEVATAAACTRCRRCGRRRASGSTSTTLIFANRTYAILRHELTNVGAENVGRKALDMLDIDRPDLDWVALARGMGVPGTRVETMDDFNASFAEAVSTRGPSLIEVVL